MAFVHISLFIPFIICFIFIANGLKDVLKYEGNEEYNNETPSEKHNINIKDTSITQEHKDISNDLMNKIQILYDKRK